MSSEVMVVHERKVHYISLDEDMVEPEDIDFIEDDENVKSEIDLLDVLASQQKILAALAAIQKKQEKQDKRFDRIDMQTGAARDVLKVINKKLPGINKEEA